MVHGIVIVGQVLAEFAQARGHHLKDGLRRVGGDLLFQVGDTQGCIVPQLTLIGFGLAADDAEQG